MTRILFGQSYYLRFDKKLWNAMQPFPPLGCLYAAGYLRQKGSEVHLFDAMLAESTDEWRQALLQANPDVAVIYEDNFNYLSKMCLVRMREAAFEMIQMARESGSRVIVSGSDATDRYRDYLEAGADHVVIGEGERTLEELVRWFEGNGPEPREGVASLTRAVPPTRRQPIRNLDDLPFPAWDLVDLARYRDSWMGRHGFYSINLVTTRGCPYRCNWCAKPIWGQRYASRTAENVVAEMEYLRKLIPYDHISFVDDIFGLKKGWIERFSEELEKKELRTRFKCLLRTDLVDERVAEALAKAGCETVWLGAESGSQTVLDAMEKGTRVSDTYRATSVLRKKGMRVCYFLQFGYPGEDWEDISQTLQMVWDNMPDDIGVSVSYPLPGTRFHAQVESELRLKKNWFDSEDLALLHSGRFSQEFYRQLHKVLHREYRGRSAWRRLKNVQATRAVLPLLQTIKLPFEKRTLRRLRGQS